MLSSSVFLHLIPLDGKFFDDAEQTIFSLVTLNAIVFALFVICLLAIRDQKRQQKIEKVQRRIAKLVAADTSTESAAPVPTSASVGPSEPARFHAEAGKARGPKKAGKK